MMVSHKKDSPQKEQETTNIFMYNPIRVHVLNRTGDTAQTLIFVGNVPIHVRKELEKISCGKKSNENILRAYYGKGWQHRVALPGKTGGQGSDDRPNDNNEQFESLFSFEDEPQDEANEPEAEQEPQDEPRDKVKPSIAFQKFDIEEIFSEEPEISVSKRNIVYVYDTVFPEDNILSFKRKLAQYTTPIHKQHMYFLYHGRTVPMYYFVYVHDNIVSVNLHGFLSKKDIQHIENFPVQQKLYNMKDSIKIIAYDQFSIMGDIYYKYGTNTFFLYKFDDFYTNDTLKKIQNDKYQIELIYYGFVMTYFPMISLEVFNNMIIDEKNISKYYPDFSTDCRNIYRIQESILSERYLKNNQVKQTAGSIFYGISKSNINVFRSEIEAEPVIHIRNLFDKIRLSTSIPMCKCALVRNGKRIIFLKYYKGHKPNYDAIPINSVQIKIGAGDSEHSSQAMNMYIFTNGNYNIQGVWREENYMDFDKIYSVVEKRTNKMVDIINSMGESVIYHGKKLHHITKQNARFTEINISAFYKKSMNNLEFQVLKDEIEEFIHADIFGSRSSEPHIQEVYFKKGMFQHDPRRIEKLVSLNNYYQYMTDRSVKNKWNTIFGKSHICKFMHRFSDIKVDIVGVKEQEYCHFRSIIELLFRNFERHKGSRKPKNKGQQLSQKERKVKKLSTLKEQDPELYSFKKLYKSDTIYSKLCQKPYQPLLLNKNAYNDLSGEEKSRVTEYWNFTSQKPAYYLCPNCKYKYVKFIVGKHPKGYCIPCCKKHPISKDKNDPKRKIHEQCLREHVYTEETRTITEGSRYVMTYGKDVEPGRISKLPEDSLEPLFYDTYSTETGTDPECDIQKGYFLYGVEQNFRGKPAMGILNCMVDLLDVDHERLLEDLSYRISKQEGKFHILLNGQIYKYFSDEDELINALEKLFKDPLEENYPWNRLFLDMLFHYYDINVLLFEDLRHSVELHVPDNIINVEDFLIPENKSLMVLKKGNKYFPIYYIDKELFFRNGYVEKKLFNSDDTVIDSIFNMISSELYGNINVHNIKQHIDLSIIKAFCSDTSYQVSAYFINGNNLCYAVLLVDEKQFKSTSQGGTNARRNGFYFPVNESHYGTTQDKIDIIFGPYSRKKYGESIHNYSRLFRDYNRWVATVSEKAGYIKPEIDKKLPLEQRVQNIYPYIKVDNWLNFRGKVVGFNTDSLIVYHYPIPLQHALKLHKVPYKELLYDPDLINNVLYNKSRPKEDKGSRSGSYGRALYKANIYNLLLLELYSYMDVTRNKTIRFKLKNILGRMDFNKPIVQTMEKIEALITDSEDIKRLKAIIADFVNNHHSKKIMLEHIDNSKFNFDDVILHKLRKMNYSALVKELRNIFRKITTTVSSAHILHKIGEFPNMYNSCRDDKGGKEVYCRNKKLMVEKDKLDDMVKVIASDILNPIKEKWLFTKLQTDRTINFFSFIRRHNEIIEIFFK